MVNKMFHAQNRNKQYTYTEMGFNHVVTQMLLHENKLLCIGNFTTYRGVPANHIIRLNLDGTIDPTFYCGTGFTHGSPINMAIQSNSNIVITCSSDLSLTRQELDIYSNSLSNIDHLWGSYDYTFNCTYNGTTVSNVFILNPNGTFKTNIDNQNVNNDFGRITCMQDNSIICAARLSRLPLERNTSVNSLLFTVFDSNLNFVRNVYRTIEIGPVVLNVSVYLYMWYIKRSYDNNLIINYSVSCNTFSNNEVWNDLYIDKVDIYGTSINSWDLKQPIEKYKHDVSKLNSIVYTEDYRMLMAGVYDFNTNENTYSTPYHSSSITMSSTNNVIDSLFNNGTYYPTCTGFRDTINSVPGCVTDLALTSYNCTIAVGNFNMYNGENSPPITLFHNISGQELSSTVYVKINNINFVNGPIYSVIYIDDSNIYISGDFTNNMDLNNVNRIIKMNIYGEIDTNFNNI